jgi:mannitol-1-phosphate 5-dehydrogenase
VGFGFGPIQAGLFLYEAHRSRAFDRLVVAEIRPEVVERLRRDGGRYRVRIATRVGVDTREVPGVEACHPVADRDALIQAIGDASELCTALPSVAAYPEVAALLAAGLRTPCVVYAAENDTRAAELLEAAVRRHRADLPPCQFADTVIGKMSGIAGDEFLVEEFNRILISRITLPGFRRGIGVFEEKADLKPFEEAKLYGHNAIHAWLGFHARARGLRHIADVGRDVPTLREARAAFVEECGAGLLARHAGVDPLFTREGFAAYADDLLARMINPWLLDTVERVVRDPRRKLGWSDRLVGAMRLALDAGVRPSRLARGAALALAALAGEEPGVPRSALLDAAWTEPDAPPGRRAALKELILHEG